MPIHLPPLRERREDIPLLAQFFLKRYGEENRRDVPELTPDVDARSARVRLAGQRPRAGEHDRAARRPVRRQVVLVRTAQVRPAEVLAAELAGRGPTTCPAWSGSWSRSGVRTAPPDGSKLYDYLVGGVERELIEQVMRQCDDVKVTAADRLGINRNTLHKKLEQYAAANGQLLTNHDVADEV